MKANICRLVVIFLCAFRLSLAAALPDQWRKWLREVSVILTVSEKAAFAQLATDEDRIRFREVFWRVRDSDPVTPQNEFREEYYRRLAVAEREYRGPISERGRIYVLMGKPQEVTHYSGYHDLVECEIWHYRSGGRPGLPPFMNILFFRPGDTGEMQLFYPGMHTAVQLLNPNQASRSGAAQDAYSMVASIAGELADATLSMIPGEGTPGSSFSIGSSGVVLSNIFALPEKEVPLDYLRSFKGIQGMVRTSETTREILGKAHIAASRFADHWFLHYSLLPDFLFLKAGADGKLTAEILITLMIQDPAGTIIHQEEKKSTLSFTPDEAKEIGERKLLFREFTPLIAGRFQVTLAFFNQTSREFFTHREEISIVENEPLLLTGFGRRSIATGEFAPYSIPGTMLLSDPRQLYSATDTLEGVVCSSGQPVVRLRREDGGNEPKSIPVREIAIGFYSFSYPLRGLADGTYRIEASLPGGRVARQPIHLMPFFTKLARPLAREKNDRAGAGNRYQLLLAQQSLNSGAIDQALQRFVRVPQAERPRSTIPLIASVHYRKREYAEVLRLLSADEIEKSYGVLVMLVNSAIEVKEYRLARSYLELLRRYDDSGTVNRRLAAICLVLGERERARDYLKHAEEVEKKGEPRYNGTQEDTRHEKK